jgi:signal transduction histidine kinase
MPTVSGLAVCEFVRARFDAARLPILVLTATAGYEDLLEALAAGANDYVAKPFVAPELVARVRGLVLTKRLGDSLREEALFRERFMAILGHDLRQPLNTLGLAARSLLRSELATAHTQTAQRIANATDRMTRMVADLLDVTRTRLGSGLPLNRRWVDLRVLCEQIVEDIQVANPDRPVNLRVSGDPTGHWDPDRLTQIFTNLLGNALEHGSEGSPIAITIGTLPTHVLLGVENVGDPISETLRPSLFEAFRRGRTKSSTGLGLGLYIVDQIVRAHGGTTTVVSGAETTSFMVQLPRGTDPGLPGPAPGAQL